MPRYSRWHPYTSALVLLLMLGICSRFSEAAEQQYSSAQTSSAATVLRANTRLVVVDAVVTDHKGEPVTDLKPEDFILLEDGKPQKIVGFSLQHGLSVPTPRPQLPVNVVSNAPQFQSGSLSVILFDAGNGDFTEHAYAKDQLLKFLKSAELSHPVAIFAMQDQLKLLYDFTTDNQALTAAVTKYNPPAQILNAESMGSRISAFSSQGDFHTNERTIENTLAQLDTLAKALSAYPGRKNLIWLSESFPLSLFPESVLRSNMDGQSLKNVEASFNGGPSTLENLQTAHPFRSYAGSVKKITDELMAAQVAVYAVDAGALSKDGHLTAQHTVEEMAEGTGGKAFKNNNDLSLSLKASMEDGSTFYTLAYYPENKTWNGEFRSIQIKTSRPALALRYRLGYYALDPEKMNQEDSKTVAEDLRRSMQLDALASSAVVFEAQVTSPTDKNKKVIVTFHVDPKTIAFAQQNDGNEVCQDKLCGMGVRQR
jgi:VWFA-related protein